MSLPPVIIKVSSEGIDRVKEALKSIEDSVKALDNKSAASANVASKARIHAAETESKTRLKLANDSSKAEERAEKEKLREIERSAHSMERIRNNSAVMAGRLARKQADDELREAKRSADGRAKFYQKAAGNIAHSIGSMASTAFKFVGSLAAIGGGFTIGDALSGQISAEKAAALASNSSDNPLKPGSRVSKKEILSSANQIGRAYGVDTTKVIEGLQTFTAKTGNAKLGQQVIDEATKASVAEGVDLKELLQGLGTIATQNENMGPEELKSTIRTLIGQGKFGAVEIKDMAHVLAHTTATAALYEGDQGENQRKLAGLAQIAIKTTGSPEEAATAINALQSDIVKHADDFRAMGIQKVKGEGGKVRDINKILSEAISETHGSAFGLRELFGERSVKIAEALTPVYQNAEKAQKGSGKQAVEDYLIATQKASITADQLNQDFKEVADTAEFRLNKTFNDLKVQVGEHLIPKLIELLPKIEELAPKFVDLLDKLIQLSAWVADNPLKAAFIGLAAVVAKGVGEAFLASKLQGMIASSLGVEAAGGAFATLIPQLALFGAAVATAIYTLNKVSEHETPDSDASINTGHATAQALLDKSEPLGDVDSVEQDIARKKKRMAEIMKDHPNDYELRPELTELNAAINTLTEGLNRVKDKRKELDQVEDDRARTQGEFMANAFIQRVNEHHWSAPGPTGSRSGSPPVNGPASPADKH